MRTPMSVFKMRNPKNAATDALVELGLADNVQEFTEEDTAIAGRWLVTFTSQSAYGGMRLEVEVLENNGTPAVCVLTRTNCPHSLMSRLMTRFTHRLTDPPRSSRSSAQRPLEDPPLSPPSQDRRGPPGGGI